MVTHSWNSVTEEHETTNHKFQKSLGYVVKHFLTNNKFEQSIYKKQTQKKKKETNSVLWVNFMNNDLKKEENVESIISCVTWYLLR